MAGAYENSIHQWRVIVVFDVDCESVLTLDESAGKLYTISANEAGSRAHKAAGASAPVVWSPKPLLRVRILLPLYLFSIRSVANRSYIFMPSFLQISQVSRLTIGFYNAVIYFFYKRRERAYEICQGEHEANFADYCIHSAFDFRAGEF
jgi:hypothetical protein